MRVVGLLLVVLIFCLIGECYPVYADDWISDATIVENRPIQRPSANSCPTFFETVTVVGMAAKQTICQFGDDSFGFGVYWGSNSRQIPVIRFSLDASYRHLASICEAGLRCVYSPKQDTLIQSEYVSSGYVGLGIYKHAKERIKKSWGSFVFDKSSADYIATSEEGQLSIPSFAVSSNGQWIVAEVRNQGILLLNGVTFEKRWILQRGYPYGVGFDPEVDMAVTNDGRFVAVGGENTGFSLIDTTSSCGGQPCRISNIVLNSVTPPPYVTRSLRFNALNDELRFYLTSSVVLHRSMTLRTSGTPNIPYLAMGDSFASGEGEIDDSYYKGGTNTKDNKCHISLRSYPYLVGNNAENVACSGAKISDVVDRQFNGNYRPILTTISVGGNDVGFMTKLKSCLMPDECEWIEPRYRMAIKEEIRSLGDRLKSLYAHMKTVSFESHLFAMSYPLIINQDGACSPGLSLLLSRGERQFIDESIKYLNQTIRRAAADAGIGYIDIEESLRDNNLCTNSPLAMNELRVGDDISILGVPVIGHESFHPTPLGHEMIARFITEHHPNLLTEPPCVDCASIAMSDYWQGDDYQRRIRQIDYARPSLQGVDVEFPPQTFSPNTDVRFEVHSQVFELGSVTSANDGSVKTTFQLPAVFEEGYHILHAIGQSYSDEPMDLYQLLPRRETQQVARNEITRSTLDHIAGVSVEQSPDIKAVLGVSSQIIEDREPGQHPKFQPIILIIVGALIIIIVSIFLLKAWRGT